MASRTTGDAQDKPCSLARREGELEQRSCVIEPVRRRLESDISDALNPVEAEVSEGDRCVRPAFGRYLAAAGPLPAADLEKIGKIGGKLDAEGQLMRPQVEITDEYPLVTCSIPNELQAVDVN